MCIYIFVYFLESFLCSLMKNIIFFKYLCFENKCKRVLMNLYFFKYYFFIELEIVLKILICKFENICLCWFVILVIKYIFWWCNFCYFVNNSVK